MTPEEHAALMLLIRELGVPLTPGGVADLLLTRSLDIQNKVTDLENKLAAIQVLLVKLTAGLNVTLTGTVAPKS